VDEVEWRRTVSAVNADVRGIIRAQRVLDEVNRTLAERRNDPTEEDRIFSDAFGFEPGDSRIISIDGVEIRIRKLHREGLRQSDILGADLIYEVAGLKFVLVQYKDANAQNRVQYDSDQIDKLISACPNLHPQTSPVTWPTCGSWYSVRGASDGVYMPACRARAVFGDAKSRSFELFRDGVGPEVFQQLFARCWIGGRIAPTELLYLGWSAMQADRVLFVVTQLGTFGR
jgi:hypothetical protein